MSISWGANTLLLVELLTKRQARLIKEIISPMENSQHEQSACCECYSTLWSQFNQMHAYYRSNYQDQKVLRLT